MASALRLVQLANPNAAKPNASAQCIAVYKVLQMYMLPNWNLPAFSPPPKLSAAQTKFLDDLRTRGYSFIYSNWDAFIVYGLICVNDLQVKINAVLNDPASNAALVLKAWIADKDVDNAPLRPLLQIEPSTFPTFASSNQHRKQDEGKNTRTTATIPGSVSLKEDNNQNDQNNTKIPAAITVSASSNEDTKHNTTTVKNEGKTIGDSQAQRIQVIQEQRRNRQALATVLNYWGRIIVRQNMIEMTECQQRIQDLQREIANNKLQQTSSKEEQAKQLQQQTAMQAQQQQQLQIEQQQNQRLKSELQQCIATGQIKELEYQNAITTLRQDANNTKNLVASLSEELERKQKEMEATTQQLEKTLSQNADFVQIWAELTATQPK